MVPTVLRSVSQMSITLVMKMGIKCAGTVTMVHGVMSSVWQEMTIWGTTNAARMEAKSA